MPVCKPPLDIPRERRRGEIPEERVSLAELVEQVKVSGGWTPKKPEQTVFNFGQDVVTTRTHPLGRTLQSGVWEKIFTLPAEYGPYIVYWKTLVADTNLIRCLTYMDGRPVSPRGIDLQDLFDYGVWQANDRIWCHIYNTVTGRYGLTFNVIEPLVGDYDFYIQNYDTVPHTLTYLYVKWYQWEKRRILKVW